MIERQKICGGKTKLIGTEIAGLRWDHRSNEFILQYLLRRYDSKGMTQEWVDVPFPLISEGK